MSACADECDDMCVNGDCIEGICQCAPGYEGIACDVVALDFSGVYGGITRTFSDCDNPDFNITTTADGDFRFCERLDEERYCLEIYLQINPDRTYQLLLTDVFIQDVEVLRVPDLNIGTYLTQGNEILLCSSNNGNGNSICEKMSLAIDTGLMTWRREEETCVTTFVLAKL